MALLLSSPHSASQDDVDDDEATGGATANGGTDLRDFEDAKSMAERLAVELEIPPDNVRAQIIAQGGDLDAVDR